MFQIALEGAVVYCWRADGSCLKTDFILTIDFHFNILFIFIVITIKCLIKYLLKVTHVAILIECYRSLRLPWKYLIEISNIMKDLTYFAHEKIKQLQHSKLFHTLANLLYRVISTHRLR